MGDLFLHLGFARRLRFAEGLHPLVSETLVRHSRSVVLGATLSVIPTLQKKKRSFWDRLFLRKASSNERWAELLAKEIEAKDSLALKLLETETVGIGLRFALCLGTLSHDLLSAEIEPINGSLDALRRRGIERAQARLWLQQAVPNHNAFAAEWRPALFTEENAQTHRVLAQVGDSLKKSHGERPTADTLKEWVSILQTEVTPLHSRSLLPDLLDVPEHEVRAKYFEGEAEFLAKTQSAVSRFVTIANALSIELFGNAEVDSARLAEIYLEGFNEKENAQVDLEALRSVFHTDVTQVRVEHLERGRNHQPAFYEPDVAPEPATTEPTNDAPVHNTPSHTQSVSLEQIEEEMAKATGEGIAAPKVTQQLDLSQIEESTETYNTPSSTQQLDLSQIEEVVGEQPVHVAPAQTQTFDASQIEEVVELASSNESAPETADSEENASDAVVADVSEAEDASEPIDATEAKDASAETEVVAKNADEAPPVVADTERFVAAADTERFVAVAETESFQPHPATEDIVDDDIVQDDAVAAAAEDGAHASSEDGTDDVQKPNEAGESNSETEKV